jgi:protection of telomeres protein 1
MSSLPLGFVDLINAYEQKDKSHNVIGLIVDHLPATKSAGTDYVSTFTLWDPSWPNGLGLKCRYFQKEEARLPQIRANGDVMLLRNLRVKDYRGETLGISHFSTSWTVFPHDSIPESVEDVTTEPPRPKFDKLAPTTAPKRTELEYITRLCNSRSRKDFAMPPPATSLQIAAIQQAAGGTPSASREDRKFSLVKDLVRPAHFSFANFLGDVRRVYQNDFRVDLSITDYTAHDDLYCYAHHDEDQDASLGDRFGYMSAEKKAWPGPWGRMTITIVLWEPHATFARRAVKEGDYVFLRNVKVCMGRDGRNLEGKIHGDPMNPDKINVMIYKPADAEANPRMKSLLLRKREYEMKSKDNNWGFIHNPSQIKSRQSIESSGPAVEESKKKGKKKNKKKGKRTDEAGAEQPALFAGRGGPSDLTRGDSNTLVRCENSGVQLKPISEILDPELLRRKTPKGNEFSLPFQNCCYRSRIRVVDYFPNDLIDFAAPYQESDYRVLSDHESDAESEMDIDAMGDIKWEWRFCLVVEDSGHNPPGAGDRAQMPLLIADKDANYLLQMDACDLRENEQTLNELREKLFVLWGDLQERKESALIDSARMSQVRARPFECLIKEYGIQTRECAGAQKSDLDYQRMFAMWGTTIA